MLVDTVDSKSVELVERAHPFRVTLSQIVVHSYYMNAVTCQGIQEHRKGCNESLTLTCSHLGNLTLMKHNATKQLNVVVNHVPLQVVTAGKPVVMIDGLVAVNLNKILCCSQFTVVVGCSNLYSFVLGKAACCILNDGIYNRKNLCQAFLKFVENLLLNLVNLLKDWLTVFKLSLFNLSLQLIDFVSLLLNLDLKEHLKFLSLCTKFIVR